MATISAATAPVALLHRPVFGARPQVHGLPAMSKKGRVMCSMGKSSDSVTESSKAGMGAALIAAVSAATVSNPAFALVDERMSTEGTGLPFGLSNNVLVWILLAGFGLIWSLYTVYTSTLDEDEESGLSL